MIRIQGCTPVHFFLFALACGFVFATCGSHKADNHTFRYFNQATTPVLADSAMVVTAHPEASRVGLEILRKGGNATDAMVAVHFALAVVYPGAGNIGGGGFMVSRQNNGEVTTLDFREVAPKRAHRDMYLNDTGGVVEDMSTLGVFAAGVPGSVAGMWEAHQRNGKLQWKQLIEPAIALASEGVRLTERESRKFNRVQDDLRKLNASATAFHGNWRTGDHLLQPELAGTLMRIADSGHAGFYAGHTAELIEAYMSATGGLITQQDLAAYRPKWRDPIRLEFEERTIYTMGPPSSGGLVLGLILGMVQQAKTIPAWNSTGYVHLLTEAQRRAYADRAAHMGDIDYYDVPIERLLSPEYAAARWSDFDADSASKSEDIQAGLAGESEETTHYSIVDSEGNAISVTTTLNGSFGARVVVPGAGFLLNNEMDDFSIKPGVPNLYGLVGGEANAIEPGKRMLSSMTPVIVEKDGKLSLVAGSPGGSTIITSVLQTVLNVAYFGMNMQEAVSALKTHHQWLPDTLWHEAGALTPTTLQELRAMGHVPAERSPIGRLDCIRITPDGLEGGADPRGDDTALGF